MLERLGFRHFAYDWRDEHVPTFDEEVEALKKHGVSLDAFWAPGVLNDRSRQILDVLKRHQVHAELWSMLDLGPDRVQGDEQSRRVDRAVELLRPLADEAAKAGCSVSLYNHGGWFGEPENQIAIIERLKAQGIQNVGMVYNLHHGHEHLNRFPELLRKMMPYLKALNLNGMDPEGERNGRKILPLGQGEDDLKLLRIIQESGYDGPIGILGHTQDDAEQRLLDNLDGLEWLRKQLRGEPAGPRPTPRTPVPPRPQVKTELSDPERARVEALLVSARQKGDAARGAAIFSDAKHACLSCHRLGGLGGSVGPDLSTVGVCVEPDEVVASVLWPRRLVKAGYETVVIATTDGRVLQGLPLESTDKTVAIRDPASGDRVEIARAEIEAERPGGSVMPDGLAEAMTETDRRDLIRFLLETGKTGGTNATDLLKHAHAPATFAFERGPLHPEKWPNWQSFVNRERVYDFYSKEADFFLTRPQARILPAYPELDGGTHGHWGNQNEDSWTNDHWSQTDLGSVMSGVLHGPNLVVPKAVCVRLGDDGELSACFDPQTLSYPAVWSGGFLKITSKRHGILDGLILDGQLQPNPEAANPADQPFEYHGFYRHGNRVIFSYRLGDQEMLDAPWVENGRFTRIVAPRNEHPLASLTEGGPARWPQVFETRGERGKQGPYATDTIGLPTENPWKALLYFGGHAFLPDGTAILGTIQGDIWRVEGLDESLDHVRWRRIATGLHQALGLWADEDGIFVLGRDQITRLRDLNGDSEIDFYECFSNAYPTSPAGHSFLTGLERDAQGRFYSASSADGILRVARDGKSFEVVATGFRNPDGIGLAPDGTITAPTSEGEWVPASMVIEVQPGGHYGYGGPRDGQPPSLPLVYLPRGLDNSSGGQVFVPDDRFGPLKGQMIHLSFGMGAAYLVLRETVDGQPQGAAVPFAGEFRSGVHRGRFNPRDGQLYVTGMTGWGTYTVDDGCFQRVRYTGEPVQVPLEFHAFENGVMVRFSSPVDPEIAGKPDLQFAQVWNYHYSPGYGSREYAPSHPGLVGHDRILVHGAHVQPDGRSVFFEIPDLQPVNQLHLRVRVNEGDPQDLFATVHKLAPPFPVSGDESSRPRKTIAAHPILADMAALSAKKEPNPWKTALAGSRPVEIQAGGNLTYNVRSFSVRAGEPIRLTFRNPDVVPHNWALIQPGTLPEVGEMVNKLIAEPDAALRNYIPRTDKVLFYTDIVDPGASFTISFHAPDEPGRYPYLCTFPGHWMVMNGEMIVLPPEKPAAGSP